MTFKEFLEGIANAIRSKTGKTDPIKPIDFAREIENIQAGGSDVEVHIVTFLNDDGSFLFEKPTIHGDDCIDVVSKGLIETPTKNPTNTLLFNFAGWRISGSNNASASALQNITSDRTLYASYTSETRYYTVRFYSDGELKSTQKVTYGSIATPPNVEKAGYILSGWEPTNENIAQDVDCHAQWIEGVSFASASWGKIDEICRNGEADKYFTIGEQKEGTLADGKQVTYTIVGINHDDLADGTGKAGLSIDVSRCAVDFTNYFTSKQSESFDKCYILTNQQFFVDKLENGVAGYIKEVNKPYWDLTSNTVKQHPCKVWPYSLTELGFDMEYLNTQYITTAPTEGERYPYFTSGKKDQTDYPKLRKYNGDGTSTAVSYWTRTPKNKNDGKINTISNYGRLSYQTYNGSHCYQINFCI